MIFIHDAKVFSGNPKYVSEICSAMERVDNYLFMDREVFERFITILRNKISAIPNCVRSGARLDVGKGQVTFYKGNSALGERYAVFYYSKVKGKVTCSFVKEKLFLEPYIEDEEES